MKKIMTLVVVSILCLTGCALMSNGPKDAVKKFLDNYKNNDQVVVDELNDYLTTEDLTDDEMKDYREIYLRQYSNLKYEIKDEKIDGDKAEVEVQITVYDYYKTNKVSGEYLTANKADFVDDKGDIDLTKYLSYKVSKLLDTTDTVDYTLTLNLNKVDDRWEIEPLTTEQLTKLHGTYEY